MVTQHDLSTTYSNKTMSKFQCKLQLFVQFIQQLHFWNAFKVYE